MRILWLQNTGHCPAATHEHPARFVGELTRVMRHIVRTVVAAELKPVQAEGFGTAENQHIEVIADRGSRQREMRSVG